VLRHRLLTTSLAAAALAACGDTPRTDPVVAPIVTAVDRAIGVIDDADAAACTLERRTIARAIETYELLIGRPPDTEADLVPDWLTEESALFDLVDGAVVPAPGSPCA